MRLALLLSLIAFAPPPPLRAEDDASELPVRLDDEISPEHELQPLPDEESPRARPREPEHRSRRFSVEESGRFGRWLLGLCEAEPVAAPEAERRRPLKDGNRLVSSPVNRQGSLTLLLANFSEQLELRNHCLAGRKTSPSACRKSLAQLRALQPAPASGAFWREAERQDAGKRAALDLVALTESRLRAAKAALQKEFFELKEIGALGENEESAARARALLREIQERSTCRTRSIKSETKYVPKRLLR